MSPSRSSSEPSGVSARAPSASPVTPVSSVTVPPAHAQRLPRRLRFLLRLAGRCAPGAGPGGGAAAPLPAVPGAGGPGRTGFAPRGGPPRASGLLAAAAAALAAIPAVIECWLALLPQF